MGGATVYLVCIPGLLASVLTSYSLFFRHADLLNVNLAVYFLPIISMIVTLILIHKTVNFEKRARLRPHFWIDGHDRLQFPHRACH